MQSAGLWPGSLSHPPPLPSPAGLPSFLTIPGRSGSPRSPARRPLPTPWQPPGQPAAEVRRRGNGPQAPPSASLTAQAHLLGSPKSHVTCVDLVFLQTHTRSSSFRVTMHIAMCCISLARFSPRVGITLRSRVCMCSKKKKKSTPIQNSGT